MKPMEWLAALGLSFSGGKSLKERLVGKWQKADGSRYEFSSTGDVTIVLSTGEVGMTTYEWVDDNHVSIVKTGFILKVDVRGNRLTATSNRGNTDKFVKVQ